MSKKRPNIILIQVESVDGRALSYLGHPAAQTPHIDALAKSGVTFSNAYCNSPICVCSRASMLSGQYVHEIETWNNHKGLELSNNQTIMRELDLIDYRTYVFGRYDHLVGGHTNYEGWGLEAWTGYANIKKSLESHPSPSGAITENGAWSRKVDKHLTPFAKEFFNYEATKYGNPFFVHLGYSLAHPGAFYSTSQEYFDRINDSSVALPPTQKDEHPCIDFHKTIKNAQELSPEKVRELRTIYLGMISELDDHIGELMADLDAKGLRENTCIILCSDHGDMQCEHGLYGKNTMYEPSVRVPLIFSMPGLEPEKIIRDDVSLIDLFPTIMDLADCDIPEYCSGHSLLPLLKGESDTSRPQHVFSEFHAGYMNTSSFMIKKGEWKYVCYPGYEPQLFNLSDDPWEVKNRATEHPDVVEQMHKLLCNQVKPEEITAQVTEYNKESLRKRRDEKGEEWASHVLDFCDDWNENDLAKLDEWIRKPSEA